MKATQKKLRSLYSARWQSHEKNTALQVLLEHLAHLEQTRKTLFTHSVLQILVRHSQ